MFIEILLAIILGIFIGIISGLIPGLHINLLAIILFSSSGILLKYFPSSTLAIFLISIAVTHIFINIIPSIFLGAPSEDYSLASLPGHRMLLQSKAYSAVILTVIGALASIVLFTISFPVIIPAVKTIYPLLKPLIPYILLIASLILILKEKEKLLAFLLFLLSGCLGLAALNLPINQPLLPLLSGLFGISILILSLNYSPKIPPQSTTFPEINKKEFAKATSSGFLASLLVCLFPGLSSSQSTILASSIFRNVKQETFLMITGFTSASIAILGFITLYSIDKARNGFVVIISKLLQEITFQQLTIFMLVSLITAAIASILTIKLAKTFSLLISGISYKKLCISIIIFITALTTLVSGFLGLFVLIISSSLGILPQIKGISKSHLMGCLILPVVLFFLL